jgi:uncharacterized protein YktB (UPF0637 family)
VEERERIARIMEELLAEPHLYEDVVPHVIDYLLEMTMTETEVSDEARKDVLNRVIERLRQVQKETDTL